MIFRFLLAVANVRPSTLLNLMGVTLVTPHLLSLEEDDGIPDVRKRRKKARFDLDQIDDLKAESPELVKSGDSQDESSNAKPTPEVKIDLADDLLPPKFLVPDIEADENAVVLPTAAGGFQVVDKTEVRVMHEGRAVKLVSLSPEELKRVRLIENLVALLIAGIMLAIAVWLVL